MAEFNGDPLAMQLRNYENLVRTVLQHCADHVGQQTKSLSVNCEMLARHLSVERDDTGSDYALAIRDNILRLDLFVQVMRLMVARGRLDLEELNEALSELHRPKQKGQR